MRVRALLLAVVLAATPLAAKASDGFDVLVFGKSFHFPDNHYNQVNPGLGLEYHWDNWFVGALTYRDSFYKQAYSAYGGYRLPYHINEDWSVYASLRVGYLNGSGFHGPVALPTVGVTYKRVSVETLFIPKNCSNCSAVVGLFLRISF